MKCNPKNSCVDCKQGGINIKITDRCNANCKFCIEKNGIITKQNPVEDLIAATNVSFHENLLILGGEPLMYPYLEHYLKGVKNKKIYLTTNGTLLTDTIAEMLCMHLSGINISIHHYKTSVNAKIFGIKDYSFDNIIDAIKVFRTLLIPVRINCNLIKGVIETREDVSQMIKFAKFIGANSIRFAEIQNCEEMWVDSSLIFRNLPTNPYVDGCEQLVYKDEDFIATVKMTCGFVNNLKELPDDPDRKQNERKVIYPNGEIKDGWYNVVNGATSYYGKEPPYKEVIREVRVSNSCY